MTRRLSASQCEHLVMLLQAGAVGRETAVTIFDHPAVRDLVPGVVAKLGELGFADRRVVSRHGSRITAYWLTAGGVEMARGASAAGLIAADVAKLPLTLKRAAP